MFVCAFFPFVVSSSHIVTESAPPTIHKMELHLWPNATSIHLVVSDRNYNVTAATSSGTTVIPPLSQGYRYCCHHGKYLLLPNAMNHDISITAIHGKYWGSISAAFIQCCNGFLFDHHTLSYCSSQHLHSPIKGSVTIQDLPCHKKVKFTRY